MPQSPVSPGSSRKWWLGPRRSSALPSEIATAFVNTGTAAVFWPPVVTQQRFTSTAAASGGVGSNTSQTPSCGDSNCDMEAQGRILDLEDVRMFVSSSKPERVKVHFLRNPHAAPDLFKHHLQHHSSRNYQISDKAANISQLASGSAPDTTAALVGQFASGVFSALCAGHDIDQKSANLVDGIYSVMSNHFKPSEAPSHPCDTPTEELNNDAQAAHAALDAVFADSTHEGQMKEWLENASKPCDFEGCTVVGGQLVEWNLLSAEQIDHDFDSEKDDPDRELKWASRKSDGIDAWADNIDGSLWAHQMTHHASTSLKQLCHTARSRAAAHSPLSYAVP